MKPILVPTDFSKAAENAAVYAFQIAEALQSNICLCHAFLIPSESLADGQVAWPLYENSMLEHINRNRLLELAKRLKVNSTHSSFRPSVSCSAVEGPTNEVFNKVIASNHAGMIIMGMSGAGALTRFFAGSTSRHTIEHINIPVMLVPPELEFNKIRKIAFATDLHRSDIAVIQFLSGFARHLEAELVVTHIVEFGDKIENRRRSEEFFDEITTQVNYDKISCRSLESPDVDKGLDWLVENGQIDMLAMVHRKRNFLLRTFGNSHTRKIANHIALPLLVFPSEGQYKL